MTGYRILKSIDIIPVHNKFGSKNYDTDGTETENEYELEHEYEHQQEAGDNMISSNTSNSESPNELQSMKPILSPKNKKNDVLNDRQKDFKSSYFNVNDNDKLSKAVANHPDNSLKDNRETTLLALRQTSLSSESPSKNTKTDTTDLKIDDFSIKKHPEIVFNDNNQNNNLQSNKLQFEKHTDNNITAVHSNVIFETPTNKPKTMFKSNLTNKSDENPFSNDFWNIEDTVTESKIEKSDMIIDEINVKQNLPKFQKTYKRRLKQKKLPLKVENSRITRSKIKKNENQNENQKKNSNFKKTQKFITDSMNKNNKPVSNNFKDLINEPKILVKGSPMNSQNDLKESKFEKSEITETVYSSQIFSSSQNDKDFTIQQAQTSNFSTTPPPPALMKNPENPVVDNKVSKNEIIIDNKNQSTPKTTKKLVTPPNDTANSSSSSGSKKDTDQDIFNNLKNLKHFISEDLKEISIDLSDTNNRQPEPANKSKIRDENKDFDNLISFNDSKNYLHNTNNNINWMNHGPSYQDLIMQSINIMSNNAVNKMKQVEKRINEKQRELHFRIDEKFNQIHNLHKLQIDNFLHKTESLIQETIINEEKLSKEFKD
ncbi:hypothetical protein B5S32_g5110 [[Candida] boidinii]|nr:hypothetical protein B5S32_g5110 [[Candida] boidinii]